MTTEDVSPSRPHEKAERPLQQELLEPLHQNGLLQHGGFEHAFQLVQRLTQYDQPGRNLSPAAVQQIVKLLGERSFELRAAGMESDVVQGLDGEAGPTEENGRS